MAFINLREETRKELLQLIAKDGLRSVARACRVHPAIIVDAADGTIVEVCARQGIIDFCAKANGHGFDYRQRQEDPPTLPSLRLRDYHSDETSKPIAQVYLAIANNVAAAGPEPYMPGSPCVPHIVPDRSAPGEGTSAMLARLGGQGAR